MTSRFLLSLVLVMGLSSCLGLPTPPPPPAVYQVQAPTQGLLVQPPSIPASLRLEVPRPAVPVGFDSERIALALQQGRRLDYYAVAKWPAALPDMLQDHIVSTLRSSLPGLHVDESDYINGATHRLQIDVQSFTPIYAELATQPPRVRVSLRFVLTQTSDDAVLSDLTLGSEIMADKNTLASVAAALETALNQTIASALPRFAAPLTKK